MSSAARGGWCVAVAGVLLAGTLSTAACTTSPADGAPRVAAPSATHPVPSQTPKQATTTGRPDVSTSPPSPSSSDLSSARAHQVQVANARLTTTLFELVSTSKKLRVNDTLGKARRPVTDALAATRASLRAERAAAYGQTVRYCSRVWTTYDAIRDNAAATGSAHRRLLQQTGLLREHIADLDRKVSAVHTADARLRTLIRHASLPPSTVTESEVKAALASASALRADTTKAMVQVEAAAASALEKAQQSVGRGWQIAARTC